MMIDTQVLSYAYKGRPPSITGARISSIVAHEFLEVYHPAWATRFRYYIKYLSGRHCSAASPSSAQWKSGMVERLILNFGADHPPLLEFNSRATASIINDRNTAAYGRIIGSLDKASQKKLRPRFSFLCENIAECVPLAAQTAELGVELLWSFVQQNTVKGSIRNSANDMLILATAITSKDDLITEDSLLARFAAEQTGSTIRDMSRGRIQINFATSKPSSSSSYRESKGYINRGWRVAEDIRRVTHPTH